MDVFTADALLDALKVCYCQDNMSICIVLRDSRHAIELASCLNQEIKDGNLPGWKIERYFDPMEFDQQYRLSNSLRASTIHIIAANLVWGIQGEIFDAIYYQDGLSENILSELKSHEKGNPVGDISESDELDEFIRGFRVVPAIKHSGR